MVYFNFIQSEIFKGVFVPYFEMMALKMQRRSELETDLSQVCNSHINFRRATTLTIKYFGKFAKRLHENQITGIAYLFKKEWKKIKE